MAQRGKPAPPRAAPGRRRFVAPIRIVIGTRDATAVAFIAGVLRRHADPVVVTTSRSGQGVIEAIASDRADLVFLDVEMEKPDPFDVIDAIGSTRMPPVVLIATTPELAGRAFDAGALDYLVRPLSRRRVDQAVNRARDQVLRERAFAAAGRVLDQLPSRLRDEAPAARIMVRAGNRMMVIDPSEIDWIEAGHNYVRLHLGPKAYRVRSTMAELEASLGVQQFARIHRGILVRLGRIRELRLKTGWRYEAVLKNGVTLPVSRTYRASLLQRLGAGWTGRSARR